MKSTVSNRESKYRFFELVKTQNQDGYELRIGRIINNCGEVLETPNFIPVATNASIRALDSIRLKKMNINGIFVNTYHLHLHPGEDIIESLGQIHKFMNYNGIIFSDSGGFQAFSLGQAMIEGVGKIASIFSNTPHKTTNSEKFAEVTDEYILFKSHIDGKQVKLTPEKSIDIQIKLGTDILMVLDECTSPLASYEYTQKSLERSHRWAIKCLEYFVKHKKKHQHLYGIIQGGYFHDLRIKSAQFVTSLEFDGIAIGGSLGTSKQNIKEILSWIHPYIPQHLPRHLLGIGTIPEIFTAIENGIDTFDCVIPTRYARTGTVFVFNSPNFVADITAKYYNGKEAKKYDLPIDPNCNCYTCKNYTVSYLHHLFYVGEIAAMSLLTIHNLHFYSQLLENIRQSILEGKYTQFKNQILSYQKT
ncbi:MAG: tRNA guanosine(34) transglycosylase Tgt [bacterium]